MDQKSKGAWIIHHSQKLEGSQYEPTYGNLLQAGKAGILLSALARSDESTLSADDVSAHATALRINPLELPTIITHLTKTKLIDTSEGGSVRVLGVAQSTVLIHTASLFQQMEPHSEEEAIIEFAEQTSNSPIIETEASEYLGDNFSLSKDEVKELFNDTQHYGFTDTEQVDSSNRIYFNGNLFRKNEVDKISRALSALNQADQLKVTSLNELLKKRGCLPEDDVTTILGQDLFERLHGVGLFDVGVVTNSEGEARFITRPAAFGKFGDPFADDALDLAKAFVACLTYGMTRRNAAQGRISSLKHLMKHLVEGRTIGPATAIGEDYKILELKGVVQITPGPSNRFYMKLLKKDIGELALQVLTEGETSDQALPNFPGSAASNYQRPEQQRVFSRQRIRNKPLNKKSQTNVLMALRTGGVFR